MGNPEGIRRRGGFLARYPVGHAIARRIAAVSARYCVPYGRWGEASDELGDPRLRDGAVGGLAPGVLPGAEVFLGVQRLVPTDDLAGVGGHAAHDRQQGAARHVGAVIDRVARADRGEELVVLGLVHVELLVAVGEPPAVRAA